MSEQSLPPFPSWRQLRGPSHGLPYMFPSFSFGLLASSDCILRSFGRRRGSPFFPKQILPTSRVHSSFLLLGRSFYPCLPRRPFHSCGVSSISEVFLPPMEVRRPFSHLSTPSKSLRILRFKTINPPAQVWKELPARAPPSLREAG